MILRLGLGLLSILLQSQTSHLVFVMAGSQWHGYWDRRRLSVKRKEVSQSENDEIGAGTEKSSPSIVAPDLVDVYEFICRHVFLSSICWLFLLFFPRNDAFFQNFSVLAQKCGHGDSSSGTFVFLSFHYSVHLLQH